jgi:DnaJ family protein A protein 5
MSPTIKCHYDVLNVPRDADVATIKKHHRKMALKYHPDKNMGDQSATEYFQLVQQAYECLSDPQERKWYDEHRESILAGWSASSGGDKADLHMLFDVVHFMHAGCYSGYHNETGGFFNVYATVFSEIASGERKQDALLVELPTNFGNGDTEWQDVLNFYQSWESFVSVLNFAWEDKYNVHEDAPDRRVRRLMEEENKKARRVAKRKYNADILALVAFVKRRDPRVQNKRAEMEVQKEEQEQRQRDQAVQRKYQQQEAKQAWREKGQKEMEEIEEDDRLAGRFRLDDDLEDNEEEETKREEEPEEELAVWRCECCQKDFESEGQLGNHMKSKKHKKVAERKKDQQEANQQEEEAAVTTDDNNKDGEKDPSDAAEDLMTTHDNDPAVQVVVTQDNGEHAEISVEKKETKSEEKSDSWRCECCQIDFESEGQLGNHMKSKKHKEQAAQRKKDRQEAKQAWREKGLNETEEAEEEDRLAGRVGLDDHDYGGGKKKRGKMKKNKRRVDEEENEDDQKEEEEVPDAENGQVSPTTINNDNNDGEMDSSDIAEDLTTVDKDPAVVTQDNADHVEIPEEDTYNDEEETESEEEPDIWQCECCQKDFKSEGQMENHTKSKKHKEAFKKYQAKLMKNEEKLMNEMMDAIVIEP